MSALRIPVLAVVYFSIATVLAEIGLLAAVAAKNGFDQEKLMQLIAVAYDIDLHSMWVQMETKSQPIENSQVSHDEVLDRRSQISLDLDLLEIATEKGLRDSHQLGQILSRERERYNKFREDFKQQEENIVRGAADQKLLDMQQRLQAMQPKQAKGQIGRFLDEDNGDYKKSLQIVVTIVKAMPLEKRKKILAEFTSPEDKERLHEILTQIRLGVPNVELIRETRNQVRQFKNRQQDN